MAIPLNNLASLHRAKNEFPTAEAAYVEALKIYRDLAEATPPTYLPYVATTLNNLAVLHRAKNEFPKAEAAYGEALEIYRDLAEVNPQTYLPDVAMTALNLSIFYWRSCPDQEKSLALAKETIVSAWPFVERLPAAADYVRESMQIIEGWDLDAEAFLREILDRYQQEEG